MPKYESLKTIKLSPNNTLQCSKKMPELVYLDDPAFLVMCDFSSTQPRTTHDNDSIDDALNTMKVYGVHQLLVQATTGNILGVIGSEDILGEAPIKIIQEKRVKRSQISAKLLMTPLDKIAAFDIKTLEHAKVGYIIVTLKKLHTHYALVVGNHVDNGSHVLRGIFTISQISRQLHMNIDDAIAKAHST